MVNKDGTALSSLDTDISDCTISKHVKATSTRRNEAASPSNEIFTSLRTGAALPVPSGSYVLDMPKVSAGNLKSLPVIVTNALSRRRLFV